MLSQLLICAFTLLACLLGKICCSGDSYNTHCLSSCTPERLRIRQKLHERVRAPPAKFAGHTQYSTAAIVAVMAHARRIKRRRCLPRTLPAGRHATVQRGGPRQPHRQKHAQLCVSHPPLLCPPTRPSLPGRPNPPTRFIRRVRSHRLAYGPHRDLSVSTLCLGGR